MVLEDDVPFQMVNFQDPCSFQGCRCFYRRHFSQHSGTFKMDASLEKGRPITPTRDGTSVNVKLDFIIQRLDIGIDEILSKQ